MFELKGKYTSAKIFTDKMEDSAQSQVIELLNQPFAEGVKVRIMSDCHAGKGCVIGFTANLGDKVIPSLIGLDIGCGMLTIPLGKINIEPHDLQDLDVVIHDVVPAGRDTHNVEISDFFSRVKNVLLCHRYLNEKDGRFGKSLGTLGGGNHFIELDKDDEDNYYLVIHTGSRNLGKQVAEFYQDMAIKDCKGYDNYQAEKALLIKELKSSGSKSEIQNKIKELDTKYKNSTAKYPDALCFLEGQHYRDYLHDMEICQSYAKENRETIAKRILFNWLGKSLAEFRYFETIHNYIDFGDGVIRKGAIKASLGKQVIIPINMRDGSIIATGLGNPDWNFSAPHGAGRLMSRGKAKEMVSMDEYKASMEGIYSTTVNTSTIDESPMAYKPMAEILANIGDTVRVDKIIKPVYNYKASE